MPLSKRFLKIITDQIIATPNRIQALAQVDPRRFYVENVRAVLRTNHWIAKQICETGVRQGILIKRVQILCPDGSVAKTLDVHDPVPETVSCHREVDGDIEEYMETTDRLDRLEFYELARLAA